MLELLALIILAFGISIPLFWIPIHSFYHFFRKLGTLTYILPLITFGFIFLIVYSYQEFILEHTIQFPTLLNLFGLIILLVGIIIHIWTAKLLSLWGLIGVPEIIPKRESRLITKGPFSLIRHPTYFAHTLIFLGSFLYTEFFVLGILTFFDFFIVNIFIIPLEEKELIRRFGYLYEEYKIRVRWRILPGLL